MATMTTYVNLISPVWDKVLTAGQVFTCAMEEPNDTLPEHLMDLAIAEWKNTIDRLYPLRNVEFNQHKWAEINMNSLAKEVTKACNLFEPALDPTKWLDIINSWQV